MNEERPFLVAVKRKGVRKYLPIKVMASSLSNAKFVASCHVRFKLSDSLYFMYDYFPEEIK